MFMIFTNDSSNASASITSTANTFLKNFSIASTIHSASHYEWGASHINHEYGKNLKFIYFIFISEW